MPPDSPSSRAPMMLDPAAAIIETELGIGSVHATAAVGGSALARLAASSSEAVLAAAADAAAGKRSAAVFAARELVGALDALGSAAARRAPITVHVIGTGATTARDELAPAL